MSRVPVRIAPGIVLVPYIAQRMEAAEMTRGIALGLLRGAKASAMAMMSLRGLLGGGQVSRLTDDQVLEEIATRVGYGLMALSMQGARATGQTKIKFADLLKNYPTNQMYPTTVATEPNIWKFIGGKVYENGKSGVFVNSCATRMSRALNYSGAPVAHATTGTSSGGDGKWYLFRVADLEPVMRTLFGTPRTLSLATWRKDIDGKTGVVRFTASWANSTGHFTLWNKDHMVNRANDDTDATDPAVNGVFFWEVK